MFDKIKITGNSTETAPDLKYGPNQEYSFGEWHDSKSGFSNKFQIIKELWQDNIVYIVYLIGNNHPDAESNNNSSNRKEEFTTLKSAIAYLKKTGCID